MPLYEYKCTKCETRFELIQKFSAPPEAGCVECGAKSERLLSAPAIQFKGSGWYVTDYANKSASSADKDDRASDAANGSGESSKDGTKSSTKDSAGDGKKVAAKDSPTKESKSAKKQEGKNPSKAKP